MKIIFLNGPPSSGKDTALRAIDAFWLRTDHAHIWPGALKPYCLRMSAPIKEAYAKMMGTNTDQYGDLYLSQEAKEQINPTLGCSPRQWQIDFSERFMKPLYGNNVFARIWLHRSAQLPHDTVIIVPDCGFDIELQSITAAAISPDYPYFTLKDIMLFRLWRKGHDVIPGTRQFRGDSREYLYTLKDDVRSADIINEDKDIFEATIIKQVTSFLTGKP